jgi:hypothetical protein
MAQAQMWGCSTSQMYLKSYTAGTTIMDIRRQYFTCLFCIDHASCSLEDRYLAQILLEQGASTKRVEEARRVSREQHADMS